ncbi:MAG TPA: DNA mismatch repair endonuclease MutL [Ktedonobacteraceae bacterium]|nr:DNA mismatch repair endonuclease MutL [Ktedonobacteraceae bacterium]
MSIRQLTPDVAAKIAAGEVVERPASVVKELIENSIDARATQIRVDLTNGGLQLIRVTDNGCGIPSEELALALSRHATSKVEDIDDLEHIRTLGFRGEALASIAAVADVTLLSRHAIAEQGSQVSAANGQLSEVSAAASPFGTTLTVRNLFSAVPARLKFLKSRHTEISHSLHMLEQYALAYPEIRFSVFSEGKQLFATPGDGQLMSVLIELYGLQVAEQMVPISSLDGRDDDPERPVVTGYTSHPACYKSTRQHISFFVNRRWVLSRMLTSAVEEGYHSLLLAGRHPIAVVNIQMDPALLDVNVHPAKTEIRFLRERRVYGAVLRAVRQGLLEEPAMPQWSGNAGTQFSPNTSASTITNDDTLEPDEPDAAETNDTSLDAYNPNNPTISPFPRDNPWLTVTEEETGSKPPMLSRLWQSHVRNGEHAEAIETSKKANDIPENSQDSLAIPGIPDIPTNSQKFQGTIDDIAEIPNIPENSQIVQHAVPEFSQNSQTSQTSSHLPKLRVVGQLSQSYIVTEGEDGMYLVDQHAAHERILLERMVAALQARTPISQLLLSPVQLELAPSEVEAIEEHLAQLEHIGFRLQMEEGGTLLVQALPNVFARQMNARSLHELLADLIAAENNGHSETWEEHALANVACKAAIKANYFLTVSEMREMIEQLGQTKAPFSCCHGRPTMIHFQLSALAREFERR